jgi:hypothetical protein
MGTGPSMARKCYPPCKVNKSNDTLAPSGDCTSRDNRVPSWYSAERSARAIREARSEDEEETLSRYDRPAQRAVRMDS